MKFPVYVNYVPQLLQWYPQCKIIHITRDPRATAMSRTNDPGGTQIRIRKYPNLAYFIKKIMVMFVVIQYIWTSKLHCKYKDLNNYLNRIIIRQLSQENYICAAYEEKALSSQSIYNIKIHKSPIEEFNHIYLLGLLNSRLLSYYFLKTFG